MRGCRCPTVGKWWSRFVDSRLDGLIDDPRPGRPAMITADQVEDVVMATLQSTPEHATHWSRAKMAQRSGLSKSSIGRIWKAFELKPHRTDGFKLSNDPQFIDKVYDVVGLYLNPPEAAVVLCVDEKSQVQALGRSQPAFPMMPGMPEKRAHDYVRNFRHQRCCGVQHRRRHRHLQPANSERCEVGVKMAGPNPGVRHYAAEPSAELRSAGLGDGSWGRALLTSASASLLLIPPKVAPLEMRGECYGPHRRSVAASEDRSSCRHAITTS